MSDLPGNLKRIPLLATLTPPVAQQNFAKDKLKKLAKTAVIHDVISPIEDVWDAMK